MALITYDEAIAHTRLSIPAASPPSEAENDLRLKMIMAESLVRVHLKCVPDDEEELDLVRAAVLKVLGNLYRFRGDDESTFGRGTPDPISSDVVQLLNMLRKPALG